MIEQVPIPVSAKEARQYFLTFGSVSRDQTESHFYSEFCISGGVVLEIGAGRNRFIPFLELKYPETLFIAADIVYGHPQMDSVAAIQRENGIYQYKLGELKPISRSKNMVTVDVNKTLPFAELSIDTFICHLSFPFWSTNSDDVINLVSEVTRVARPGAQWFVMGAQNERIQNTFVKTVINQGWKRVHYYPYKRVLVEVDSITGDRDQHIIDVMVLNKCKGKSRL